MMSARLVHLRVGPIAVELELEGSRSRQLVDDVFVPEPGPAPDSGGAVHRLFVADLDGGVFGVRDGREDRVGATAANSAAALEWLTARVSARLAESCHRGLLVHAGATQLGGGALIWPGDSGSGKSTLVAWLLSRGHGFLSDELALLADAGAGVHGLRRALNLKPGSMEVARLHDLAENVSARVSRSEPARGRPHLGGLFLPTHRLAPPEQPPRLVAMAFPRFSPGAPVGLRRLTPAQASYHLLRTTINARIRPDRGMAEAVRVAQAVPAFELRYPGFEVLGEAMDRIEAAAAEAN